MKKGEELTNSMNINYNIYYQNYINVNNIISTHDSNPDEKLSKPQTFHFNQKIQNIKKNVFTEKVKPNSPAYLEIPSRIFNLQPKKEVQKELLSALPQTKEIDKIALKEIYEVREEYFQSENLTEIIGSLIITMAAIFFIGLFYAMFGSKLLGPTGNYLLDFIREDEYYCFLLPLLLPVTVIALYCNWVSMKFFRHS